MATYYIINSKINDNPFSFSKYNDNKYIYLFEKLANFSSNKLLNFCRLLDFQNNIEDLQNEFNDMPKCSKISELIEYYYYLNEKEQKDNLFKKYEIQTYKEIEILKDGLKSKQAIQNYFKSQIERYDKKLINGEEVEQEFNELIEQGKVVFPFELAKNNVNEVLQNLKQKFKCVKNKYDSKFNFGISFLNQRLVFYDYGNKELLSEVLSNAENIKQYKN